MLRTNYLSRVLVNPFLFPHLQHDKSMDIWLSCSLMLWDFICSFKYIIYIIFAISIKLKRSWSDFLTFWNFLVWLHMYTPYSIHVWFEVNEICNSFLPSIFKLWQCYSCFLFFLLNLQSLCLNFPNSKNLVSYYYEATQFFLYLLIFSFISDNSFSSQLILFLFLYLSLWWKRNSWGRRNSWSSIYQNTSCLWASNRCRKKATV